MTRNPHLANKVTGRCTRRSSCRACTHVRERGELDLRAAYSWTVVALIVFALWYFVFPPALGGRTTFLTTHGVSMQPLLYAGDLAVIREQHQYKVGDVIAFHSRTMNTTLLHRVVSIDGKTITTQGDNNSWLDVDHPEQSDIIGKMLHRYKGAGKYVEALKNPITIIVAIAFVLMGVVQLSRDREQLPSSIEQIGSRNARAPNSRRPRGVWSLVTNTLYTIPIVVVPLLLVAAISGAFCIVAFNKETTSAPGRMLMYSLKGDFNYTADVIPGKEIIYEGNRVKTGDPIYTNAVRQVALTYTYSFSSMSSFKGHASIQTEAVLKGKTGWQHHLPAAEALQTDTNNGVTFTTLDIAEVQRLASDVSRATGIAENTYDVVIHVEVKVNGQLGKQDLTDSMSSELVLRAANAQWVVQATPVTSPASKPNASESSQATPVTSGLKTGKSGTIPITHRYALSMNVFGAQPHVETVRVVSAILFVFSLLIATVIWKAMNIRRSLRRLDDDDDYNDPDFNVLGDSLVNVPALADPPEAQIVDVPDLASLAKIARDNDGLVLRHTSATKSTFIYNDGSAYYRFCRTEDPNARHDATTPQDSTAPQGEQR